MQRKALGKGLKALIPVVEEKREGILLEIPVEEVSPNRYQPRKMFNDARLDELVSSIKEKGIVQPIIVQKTDSGYELIAGERRWRAAQKAGMEKIPAIVKEVTSEGSLELALIENIQRENLNPMEEARAYQRLADEFHLIQEEIAKKVGKDRSSVANYLRLLRLPQEIQDSIAKKELPKKTVDIFENRMEEELQKFLGTKVNIIKGRKRGKIEIIFYSDEDFERIIELIRGR